MASSASLGSLEWEVGDGTPRSEARSALLKDVLSEGLQYHPEGGFLQLAFPTAEDRSALIEALNGEELWCFSGGGDDSGEGARNWSYTVMKAVDLEALRQLALTKPAFASLLRLHDSVQRVANELDEAGATPTADARKGAKGREGDALQHM